MKRPEFWLPQEDWPDLVRKFYAFGIVRRSRKKDIPIKSGFTDLKIEMRLCRGTPESISYLANLYAFALRQLSVDRFVEVPNSFSPVAGHLSVITKTPFLTLPKGDTELCGPRRKGDRVAIFDDTITRGDSKVAPYNACKAERLAVTDIVVAIDREEGWQEYLPSHGVFAPVWAAMPLSAFRRHLAAIT